MEKIEFDETDIVKNIKYFRKKKKMSQQKLAELCGFTKSYISKIEKSGKAPPFSTMYKIAMFLGINSIQLLFPNGSGSYSNNKLTITRNNESTWFSTPNLPSIKYQTLALKKYGRNMDPFLIEIGFEKTDPVTHEGEEFLYVLEGEFKFTYGDKEYDFFKGDSMYFDSEIPHSLVSTGHTTAKILSVLYSYKRIGFSSL